MLSERRWFVCKRTGLRSERLFSLSFISLLKAHGLLHLTWPDLSDFYLQSRTRLRTTLWNWLQSGAEWGCHQGLFKTLSTTRRKNHFHLLSTVWAYPASVSICLIWLDSKTLSIFPSTFRPHFPNGPYQEAFKTHICPYRDFSFPRGTSKNNLRIQPNISQPSETFLSLHLIILFVLEGQMLGGMAEY